MTEGVKSVLDIVNTACQSVALQTLKSKERRINDGLSSGSFRLNYALSGNPFIGYAFGRIVEIYGPEQSGKTTLALHAIKEAQKVDLPCVFVDAEHALDPIYAEAIGVKLDDLLINQPNCGEDAITIVEQSVLAGAGLVVVDSVAALTPRSEIEGEVGDAHMGKHARLMGQSMRKLTARIGKARCIVIFLNQIRMKIGVMFGSPETTTGGNALKFFASYRLDVRSPRGGAIQSKSLEGGKTVETGILSKVKVVKNKLYPPFRLAELQIDYGKGIDLYADLSGLLFHLSGLRDQKLLIDGVSYGKKGKLLSDLQESSTVRKAALALLKKWTSE